MHQIISAAQLQSAKNILLILDLTLKDFLFIQSYLAEFANKNPHIKIDLWINLDCQCWFKHKQTTQEKMLLEFIQECSFINHIYLNSCSSSRKLIAQARECCYPIIVLFSNKNLCRDIKLAKKINAQSYLVGQPQKLKRYDFFKRRTCKYLSSRLDWRCQPCVVDEWYNDFFMQLLGEQFIVEHKVKLNIPRKWVTYAKLKFLKWGIDKKGQRFGKAFFINAFDDNDKQVWELKYILNLIKNLKVNDEWGDINCVLHVPISKLRLVRKFFAKHSVNNLYLFSADNNFFQLPSILSLCDGAFSVEGFCKEQAKLLNVKVLE